MANQIRLLIRAQTGAELPMLKGPKGPIDRIKDRETRSTMTWFNGLFGR